jgi:hypothetical protein
LPFKDLLRSRVRKDHYYRGERLRPPKADRIWRKRISQFESQSHRAQMSSRNLLLARRLLTRATDVANLLSDAEEKAKTLERLLEKTVGINQAITKSRDRSFEYQPVMA